MKNTHKKIATLIVVTIIMQLSFVSVYANNINNISTSKLEGMSIQEKMDMLNSIPLEELRSNYTKYEELVQSIEKSIENSPALRSEPIDDKMDDYFNSWAKIYRDGRLSYSLDPNSNVRLIRYIAKKGWSAVCQNYQRDPQFTNEPGLYDQYLCHYEMAALKDRWNLEPDRPDVSFAATLAALCNPE